MKSSRLILGIIAAAVVATFFFIGTYNSLVGLQGAVQAAWANVETQYQRRFDLVPNLVSTVKGAAEFEQETFTAVTAARSQWQSAPGRDAKIAAAGEFESALSRLLVTVESYPQLKATQAFTDLMAQLEGTENRISVARKDFNDATMAYNVSVRTFPRNIVAGFFGFNAEKTFEAAEGAEVAPSVRFGDE